MQFSQSTVFAAPEIPVVARFKPWLSVIDCTLREFAARADIVQEEKPIDELCVVVEGWAARNKLLIDGSRQISALWVRGDMFNFEALLTGRSRHSVSALTPVTVACFTRERVRLAAERDAHVRSSLWAGVVRQELVLMEWLACLGRRSTRERLAHLLCELEVRLFDAGLARDGGYMLPLTQQDFGDALGVSTVHINRTLKVFKADGLVHFRSGRMHIPDLAALRRVAGFDPDYLRETLTAPQF